MNVHPVGLSRNAYDCNCVHIKPTLTTKRQISTIADQQYPLPFAIATFVI